MIVALTETERLLYQTRLDDARKKRHDIITGTAVRRFIDQNGETVEYSQANLGALDRYIDELVGLLNPAIAAYNRKRPIGFTF
jgi:hypothetical protein